MKRILIISMLLLAATISVPAQAQPEPFVPYDNFNTFFLDPDKWIGVESNSGVAILESSREINWGSLHLSSRAYGATSSDTGWNYGSTRASFDEPTKVTAIKARVQANFVEAKGCASNTQYSRASIRLGGLFFNTDTPTSGNAMNDVLAYISLQRQSNYTDYPYLLHVVAAVYHCTNSNCTQSQTIGSIDMGTISVFWPMVMSIQWDQGKHRFIFQLDNQPPVYISYTFSDTSPPGSNNKRIEITHILPNCTTKPRPVAVMDAYIDNVFVNQSAAP